MSGLLHLLGASFAAAAGDEAAAAAADGGGAAAAPPVADGAAAGFAHLGAYIHERLAPAFGDALPLTIERIASDVEKPPRAFEDANKERKPGDDGDDAAGGGGNAAAATARSSGFQLPRHDEPAAAGVVPALRLSLIHI